MFKIIFLNDRFPRRDDGTGRRHAVRCGVAVFFSPWRRRRRRRRIHISIQVGDGDRNCGAPVTGSHDETGNGWRGRPLVRRLLSSVTEEHRVGEHYDQAEHGQHVDGHLAADRTPVAVLHGCWMFACRYRKQIFVS